MSLWRQATLRREETLEPSADTSTSMAPLYPTLGAGTSTLVDDQAAELDVPPPAHSDPDHQDDMTMPTWGLPPGGDCFEYGAGVYEIGSEGEEDLPTTRPLGLDTGSGYEPSTRSPTPGYDPAVEWSTDVGYSSGSEADAESDAETPRA